MALRINFFFGSKRHEALVEIGRPSAGPRRAQELPEGLSKGVTRALSRDLRSTRFLACPGLKLRRSELTTLLYAVLLASHTALYLDLMCIEAECILGFSLG